MIDVTYLLDTPHGFEWKGMYVDADLRALKAGACEFSDDPAGTRGSFRQISALEGSILENRIPEDDFQVGGISTARLFSLAHEQYKSPPVSILYINNSNLHDHLPTLPLCTNTRPKSCGYRGSMECIQS